MIPIKAMIAAQGYQHALLVFGIAQGIMGRVIAERLRRRGNPKSIAIENRVGASGTLACEALRHAAPDGTTVNVTP